MPDHVAFLKGMNLGRRRITNADLSAAVEGLGFEDVQTFRASGNVAFKAGRRSDVALQSLLEDGLRDKLGYGVPAFIRSAAELRGIVAADPFGPSPGAGKLQVALLHDAPDSEARDAVLALADAEERLAFAERELYWLPAGGVSDSTLDFKRVERLVGLATVRTLGTIEQIVARWFS
ncbi:MAG TPA: DUF1697 domain-containing protein [Solirubrobacteraceae bacterium]